jgi:hypothetical protein
MRQRRPTNAAFAERQETVARIHLEAKSAPGIAARLRLNRTTVWRDLQRIEARWRDAAQRNPGDFRGRLLAELDWLKRAFREAWEAAMRPHESNIVQRKEPSGDQVIGVQGSGFRVRRVLRMGGMAGVNSHKNPHGPARNPHNPHGTRMEPARNPHNPHETRTEFLRQ